MEDQLALDALLYKIQKYRHVYEQADDPQRVQLWLISLELEKELELLTGRRKPESVTIRVEHPVSLQDDIGSKIRRKQELKAQGKIPERSDWVKKIEENW